MIKIAIYQCFISVIMRFYKHEIRLWIRKVQVRALTGQHTAREAIL